MWCSDLLVPHTSHPFMSCGGSLLRGLHHLLLSSLSGPSHSIPRAVSHMLSPTAGQCFTLSSRHKGANTATSVATGPCGGSGWNWVCPVKVHQSFLTEAAPAASSLPKPHCMELRKIFKRFFFKTFFFKRLRDLPLHR